jgi:predicted RNA binding protein YcfA (HicA-like mRNA interferase family)
MKLPRDITGEALANALKQFGYETVRQTGSHIRLTTQREGEHHITIPNHSPLKTGTLSAILKDIASHFRISRDDLLKRLFD